MSGGASLPGVELFATGKYRGKRWFIRDLQEMADNARKLGPQGLNLLHPPVVFGHEEDQPFFERTDWPASGYVEPRNVHVVKYYDPVSRQMEGKLIGDLEDVPPAIANLIKAKRYKKVSAEIYDNFEDDFGRKYGKAIRRVALLGAEVPQVKRLADLPDPVYKHSETCGRPSRLLLVDAKATAVGTTIYTFAESVMQRTQLIATIQAAMPGMSQASLDGMSDDVLAELVKNLPAPAAATPAAVATTPAAGTTQMADMPREDLIDALTQLGQSPEDLQGLGDDELQALYDELSDQGATQFDDSQDPNGTGDYMYADDPATMSHDDLIAALTAAGQDPTALASLTDDQLKQLYTQILGGTDASATPVATTPSDTGAAAASMTDAANGVTQGSTDARAGVSVGMRPNPDGDPNVNPAKPMACRGKATPMSDRRPATRQQQQAVASATKLHRFTEREYQRVVKQSRQRRRQDAESFCDRLIGEGRLTPALKQTVYMPLLLTLDDTHEVWQFNDNGVNKVLTAYESKKLQLAKLPIIVRMGERIPHDPSTAKQAGLAEVNKVERFAELYGSQLKVHGFDAKKTIEQAKKMAEKNPDFRAADLIGESAARMLG